jgi:tetratricopeptide (TPR) repeat protein
MSRKNRQKNKPEEVVGVVETKSTELSRHWIIGLVLGATFLVFANTLDNGFVYDDTTQILQNQFIRHLSNVPKALVTEVWFWRSELDKDPTKDEGPSTAYYRPTFIIYLMIAWQIFQDMPFGWHLLSVLMHMLAVYLSFLVLEKITGDIKLSGIAALLFALHPLRVESVAWISGVTDPILAVFLLLTFYFYLRHRETRSLKHLLIAMAMFLFAAFSKEPAICLPIFLGVYELFIANQDKPFRSRIEPAFGYGAFFFVTSIFYFLMRYKALGFVLGDEKFVNHTALETVLTIPIVIWKYIGLLFVPISLSIFHDTPMIDNPLDIRFILPVLALVALAAGLWRLRHSMIARFGILWFFVHLLPVLNVKAFDEAFLVQERYAYVPSIGFSLLIAMALLRLPIDEWLPFRNRTTSRIAAVALLVLLFSVKTFAQNMVWKEEMAFWKYGAETGSDQRMAHFILGHQYIKANDPNSAIKPFEDYLKLDPENIYVMANLASAYSLVYEATGDRQHLDRSIALCEKVLKINKYMGPAWDTLGRAYTFDTELKNLNRAVELFNQALRVNPDNAMVLFHLGATYVKGGDSKNGLPYLEKAQQLQPDLPDIYNFLARAYRNVGRNEEAIKVFELYLKMRPNSRDAAEIRQEITRLRNQPQPAAQNE